MSFERGDGLDVATELIEDAPCGIAVTDPDGRLRYVNKTLTQWLGLPPGGDPSRATFASLLTGPGRIFYDTHMAPMMRLQGFVREISCTLDVQDGPPLPVMLSGVARRDAQGVCTRFDYTVFDARERRAYEEALRRAKREAGELAAIVSSSPNAILRVDSGGCVRSWNNGAVRLLGRSAEQALGRPVAEAIQLLDRPGWFMREARALRDEAEISFEARHASARDFEVTLAPIGERGLPGASEDWSVILRDVTRRKQAERRLQVIFDEMRHRMKNTLGVVAGIARQTLPRPSAEQLVSRLQALSSAHDALIRPDDDIGSEPVVEIGALLAFSCKAAGGSARFVIQGPRVRLSARQATSMSMALHELVTNALKYGALSSEQGQVRVDYTLDGPGETGPFRLRWREVGGPPVTPPTRQGFGSKMIGLVLQAELGAEVRSEFAPEGFRFEVAFTAG